MKNRETLPKKEFIHTKLNEQLNTFEKKRLCNRNAAIRYNICVAVLGAFITVLAGINITGGEEYARITILIISSIIAILGTYNSFFNYKELWIKYTMVTNELKKIKSDFEFYLTGKEDEDIELSELENFNKMVDDILDSANKNWKLIRLKK
ncbi:DUF4231 domain-containing protein [Saccharicrinis sp. FJH62]|uniref:DUF4231 domain-containing protein n=1 Tax=Saccharicrinis sp. FJH62 TaxID=3344657 RepID=UPI0035D49D16